MIGIFDSGVGGLTVVKEIQRQLPGVGIIYFGDTARTPYGNKGEKAIISYSLQNVEFLVSQGAEVIVIGCNTASAIATEAIKEKYPQLPIFEVISPAVAAATKLTKNKRIGVIGTRATVNSGAYQKLIRDQDDTISVLAKTCPLFVPLVEENWLDRSETKMIARRYLQGLKQKSIDTLILGCTHYPLLKPIISAKIGSGVQLVDSAEEVAKEIKDSKLVVSNSKAESKFFFSDLTDQVRKISQRWLGKDIILREVSLD